MSQSIQRDMREAVVVVASGRDSGFTPLRPSTYKSWFLVPPAAGEGAVKFPFFPWPQSN